MEKIGNIASFQEHQNIILEGFDPVSAGGFTQLPNCVLNDPHLSPGGKVVYAKLLSYAWYNNRVFPGQEKLAEEIGAGKRTIIWLIAELEKRGYVEVKRRGQGLTNVYVLRHTVKHTGKKWGRSAKMALLEMPHWHLLKCHNGISQQGYFEASQ